MLRRLADEVLSLLWNKTRGTKELPGAYYDLLIVGSGLTGATIARLASDDGYRPLGFI
jgi:hypothetical protein